MFGNNHVQTHLAVDVPSGTEGTNKKAKSALIIRNNEEVDSHCSAPALSVAQEPEPKPTAEVTAPEPAYACDDRPDCAPQQGAVL